MLVTYASRRGGTAELAQWIGSALVAQGLSVIVQPVHEVPSLEDIDAVVLGSSVYNDRWDRRALRFVSRFDAELRVRPLWMFSSGPLDDSAAGGDLDPPARAAAMGRRLGAVENVVMGGRLEAQPRGHLARWLARSHAGDWRRQGDAQSLADRVARHLAASSDTVR